MVRDFAEKDIKAQDAYFNNATDEYLLSLGVDPSKIRNRPPSNERMIATLNTPVKSRTVHTYAVDIDGKIAGISTVKKIKFGESAEMHGHLFDLENRQKGIASGLFKEIIKKVFETFDVKLLIFEPNAVNVAPNALLQKMGLKVIATYKTPAEGILLERTANRYEMTRDWFNKING